jgi:CO/xanthine dehydrogenase Mo-binding subunit
MIFDGDFNTGAYASWGPTVATRVPIHASGPYFTPNYKALGKALHTNGPISGAFRGFGVPQAAALQETLYDQLADICNIDQLNFRKINALRDGEKTVCGQKLEGVGILECLDALTVQWEQANILASKFNKKSSLIKKGVGLGSCWYGCGNTALPNPATIKIGINKIGKLFLHQGATDVGQGSNTVITQICADALGVSVDDFTIIGPDTFLTPDCGKTSASRQTYITGKAAELAGKSLRNKILRLSNMGSNADINFIDQNIVIEQNNKRHTLKLCNMIEDKDKYVISSIESYDPPTIPLDENGQGKPYAVYGYGVQMAEIEVDVELGIIKIIKITAAHDLGKVINPLLAEGQIEGGIAQGLGLALMEEYIPDKTENLHDYLIPTIGDMPEIQSILIEKEDPEGPFGAKGLGEHVLIPTAPAILNALRNCTGAIIKKLPALPHRVLEAIKEVKNDTRKD